MTRIPSPTRRRALLAGAVAAGVTSVALVASPAGAGPVVTGTGPAAVAAAAFENAPIGYGAGTTGGAGGATVTVTTLAQLVTEAKSTGAKTIKVSGMLRGTEQIYVTSDKTIVGVGAGSGLTGAGLFIKKAHNVIVRNLRISLAKAPVDLIQIQKSDHVWIDHNELFNDRTHDKDYYDGLLDINHGSTDVTVSWNHLHDHFKGSLVGHSDKNAAEDASIRVTYGHNWFSNVDSRLPRIRFGHLHAYDNLFENAPTSGIHCLMNAQCLIQNNVFVQVNLPVWTTEDSPVDGYANASGNDYGGAAPVITRTGTFTSPPYAFTLDPTAQVAAEVRAGAGTGKVG
ncbi:polysaccharide lyase family 1 protein [Streptomyces sp. NPDC006733]|uniref:pectate lyase family protein n=1 Tax=Streptomyces sp. NPDC006733 TaxID=3155460 RepID=UPI003400E394